VLAWNPRPTRLVAADGENEMYLATLRLPISRKFAGSGDPRWTMIVLGDQASDYL
jgi:hypothetical protein